MSNVLNYFIRRTNLKNSLIKCFSIWKWFCQGSDVDNWNHASQVKKRKYWCFKICGKTERKDPKLSFWEWLPEQFRTTSRDTASVMIRGLKKQEDANFRATVPLLPQPLQAKSLHPTLPFNTIKLMTGHYKLYYSCHWKNKHPKAMLASGNSWSNRSIVSTSGCPLTPSKPHAFTYNGKLQGILGNEIF